MNKQIRTKVLAITHMAMQITESGIAHVFTNYSGHVNSFSLTADPVDTVYKEGHERVSLVNLTTYLDRDYTEEKLDQMISALQSLVQDWAGSAGDGFLPRMMMEQAA